MGPVSDPWDRNFHASLHTTTTTTTTLSEIRQIVLPASSGASAGAPSPVPNGAAARSQASQGELQIREAHASEERGEIAEAYAQYRQGLIMILEGVRQLGAEDPLASSQRQKVANYVEHADSLDPVAWQRPRRSFSSGPSGGFRRDMPRI